MYIVNARFYNYPDQFGESFVLTSDNGEKDLRLEVGTKVKIVAICCCGKDAELNYEGKEYLCEQCFYEKFQNKDKGKT